MGDCFDERMCVTTSYIVKCCSHFLSHNQYVYHIFWWYSQGGLKQQLVWTSKALNHFHKAYHAKFISWIYSWLTLTLIVLLCICIMYVLGNNLSQVLCLMHALHTTRDIGHIISSSWPVKVGVLHVLLINKGHILVTKIMFCTLLLYCCELYYFNSIN